MPDFVQPQDLMAYIQQYPNHAETEKTSKARLNTKNPYLST